MNRKIRIGFSFNISKGSASNFLNSLRHSLKNQKLARVSFFINPFNHCNIFANKVRDLYKKPYFFRVDGIAFDLGLSKEQKSDTNDAILSGMKKSKGVIFQSHFAKELCAKMLDFKPKNFSIITNGVDLDVFTDKGLHKREELNIEKDALVFITTAKWRAHKRLKDIINTFHNYRIKSKKKCYLIVIGTTGDDFKNNENVIFIDRIERNQMPEYLRSANIFLFYSWLDNCPNSVVEAIACNVPVICTNQGGTKEIIQTTNGGIVVDADKEFNYVEVDLYKPPKPDYLLIEAAINNLVNNLSDFISNIDKSNIDIKVTAKKYYNFISKTLEKK